MYPNNFASNQPMYGPFQPNQFGGYFPYGQVQQPQPTSTPQQTYIPQRQQNPIQGIQGRIVNDIAEIQPNEVPMDGTVGIFPQSDYSTIYAKAWNKDGTITTTRYIPEPQLESQQAVSDHDFSTMVMERLDRIEKMLKGKPRYSKPRRDNVEQTTEEA